MKFVPSVLLTIDEIISMNEEWMKRHVKGIADMCCTTESEEGEERGAEKLFRFELNNLAKVIARFPAKEADFDEHIQFWLENCSDGWYDGWYTKCEAENKPMKANVIVQFDKYGQTCRRWICCEDTEIH